MAGDWIKMRTDLFTHPKVVRISSALKADRLRTVGGLMSAWCLFDAHSVDGILPGYTSETLDDHLGWPGFSAAVIAVNWLADTGESLSLPEFETHNGVSAKRRAQDADRKQAVRKTSASEADKLRTREEKRREEKKEPKAKATVRSTPAPDAEGLFPEAWLAYPKRAGSNSRADALKCWQARLRGGESPEAMLAGTRRFAHFSAATGKTGTEFVMQAAKFYGKSMHYREAWELPAMARPPVAAPSKTLAAIQRLEAMKHGLADSRDYDGTAKAALPWAGSDSGNGLD